MSAYQYTPLNSDNDEFRLIKLWPGNLADPLEIDIFHTPLRAPAVNQPSKRLSLSQLRKTLPEGWGAEETLEGRYAFDPPGDSPNQWNHPDATLDPNLYEQQPIISLPYEALSYVWGPQEPSDLVHVRPDTALARVDSSLSIGPSLATALRRFRQAQEVRVLWIDAICINQKDVSERNVQVKRMAQIYSLASRVLIWLGEESDDSKHAMETLWHFSQQVLYFKSSHAGDAPGAKWPDWFRMTTRMPYDDRTWSAINALINRPWFSRVWVLQEARLANRAATVYCGQDSILWDAIMTSILSLQSKASTPMQMRKKLSALSIAAVSTSSILELLEWARHQGCTDQRDRVYGVLGLCDLSLNQKLEPNYDLSTSAVYRSAMVAYLDTSSRLGLLKYCDITTSLPAQPSWVPNWSADGDVQFRTADYACGNTAAYISHDSWDAIRVQGKWCTEVLSVGAIARGDYDAILKTVRGWESDLRRRLNCPGADQGFLKDFMTLVAQGRTRERLKRLVGLPSVDELIELYLASQTRRSQQSEFLRKFIVDLDGWRFFTTKHGSIGMSPVALRSGDQVYVVLGCSSTILLRTASDKSFQVIGPCRIHGLNDGEALLGPMPTSWTVEDWRHSDGYLHQYFRNGATGELTSSDPRLPPLPSSWVRIERERSAGDSEDFREFKNLETGELLNSDPRMLPKALKERGTVLEEIRLV